MPLRKAKMLYNFGLSMCNRVKQYAKRQLILFAFLMKMGSECNSGITLLYST